MAASGARSARGGTSRAVRKKDQAETTERMLTIGELAERTHVSTRTIRYYEELGILPTPERSSGGTRRYPHDYIFYVEGVRVLKDLGFGLEEIAELGQFALSGSSASKRTRGILEEKLGELDHQIRVLNRLHDLVMQAATSRGTKGSRALPLLRQIGENLEAVPSKTGTAG